jgi:predicted transcriptional regulator
MHKGGAMAIETTDDGRVLSLPFQAEEMSYVRMTQAELSRLFGVTRGAVSQWVKNGKITTYADGRIDPSRAASELVKNCDINKLQAKPFKPLKKEVDALRAQAKALRDERDAARAAAVRFLRVAGETSAWLDAFERAVRALADPAAVDAAFDQAGATAMQADAETILGALDPDLLADHPEVVELLQEAEAASKAKRPGP